MHAHCFSLKRAHHSVLRIGRPLLLAMGLTAARFDMLFALKIQPGRRMLQRHLQDILGVGRTTVSVMLASLEELGLVERTVDPDDRRRNWVTLTKRGFRRIAFAYRHLSRSGWAQLALDTAFGGSPSLSDPCDWSDPEQCARVAEGLENALWGIRTEFRDRGSLEYPLGEPDDDNPFTWFDEDFADTTDTERET